MRRFVHWAWPLLATVATVAAVARLFAHIEFSRRDDGGILLGMGLAFVVALAFLVGYTRVWTLRGLGQVATYLGDATLYLILGAANLGWRGPLRDWEANTIRAAFVVGGAFLVCGLGWWAWSTRGTDLVEPTDPGVPDAVLSERTREAL
jgi:hypothetical protein